MKKLFILPLMSIPIITTPDPQSVERAIKLLRKEHTKIHQIIEHFDRGSPLYAKALIASMSANLAQSVPIGAAPSLQASLRGILVLERTISELQSALQCLENNQHTKAKNSIVQSLGWLAQVLITL
jgi:hypothetical protein